MLVGAGDVVDEGDAVLEVRWEEEREPVAGTDAEGNPTSTPRAPLVRTATVPVPPPFARSGQCPGRGRGESLDGADPGGPAEP